MFHVRRHEEDVRGNAEVDLGKEYTAVRRIITQADAANIKKSYDHLLQRASSLTYRSLSDT